MRTSFYDFCVKQGHRALLAQWDEVRNAPLTTGNVSFGSHQKVWWQCSKGHSWQAKVYSRSAGSGCPYCTGRKEVPENSLAVQVPSLEAEWDAEKNAPLKFADLTIGSHKKVWWRCPAGHSYDSVVKSRVLGTGCPVCAGRVVLPDENSLAARYPALVAEWDTEKNAPLLPTLVAPGTVRKAWWRCPKGHSYRAAISSRAGGGTGCPFCAGQKVIQGENDLATQYPQLAAQWDRQKNGALTPELVTAGSNRHVWWRCEKGHSYPAVIAHRVRSGSDCPYCSNHKVLPGFNDLATIEPVVASQWHPTRNGSLTPQQVTPGSRRKVWWLCDKGHAWRAVVNSRTGKQRCGCPICAGRPLDRCTAILSEPPAEPVKISAQTAGSRGKYTCRRIIMKHKLLSILLCLAMALSLLPTAALAEEATGAGPIKVGNASYESFSDAVNAATPDGSGVITYEISGKVDVTATGWVQVAKADLTSLSKVAFVGITDDAEICITGDLAILADQKYDIDVSFTNLKLSKPNPTYGGDYGHSTNYFTCWLRNTGAANNTVTYTDCTFPNGVCNNHYGKTVFDDCKFTNAAEGKYNLWNYGGNTEIKSSEFTGTRGIKAYSEGADGGDITVADTTFTDLTEKAAIIASKPVGIVVEDISVSGDKGFFTRDISGNDEVKLDVVGSGISGTFYVTSNTDAAAAKSEFNITAGTFTGTLDTDYLAPGATINESGTVEMNPVAKVGTTEYNTLEEAFAALNSNNYKLELLGKENVQTAVWPENKPVYWQAGDKSGYVAKLTDALTAAYKANAGAITIVCRPGADVGTMTHGHVADNLTIYGNNAYLSGGECDLEVDTFKFSRSTGAQANDGAYLDKNITITAYELDNLGVWGQRNTSNTVSIVLTDCDGKAIEGKANVQRVYISGNTGVNNITLINCDFLTKATAVYSNADGEVTIKSCSFTGSQVPVNINHKAGGTQTVMVMNSTFTNCGDKGEWKQFAAPIRFVNSGSGTMSANVDACTITGTVGNNGDILIGDGRTNETSNDVTLTVSGTAASVQAQKPGYYNDEGTDDSKKAERELTAADSLNTTIADLLPVTKVDLDEFIKLVTSADYNFDGASVAGTGKKLTVKWSPDSGCFDTRTNHTCTVGGAKATGNTPNRINSNLAQYQLFKSATNVTIKNVNFVYVPNDFTICANSGWASNGTADEVKSAQLQLETTGDGDVTIEGCSFDHVVFTSWQNSGETVIKNSAFKNIYGSYAIKDLGGSSVEVSDCTFENCGGGIMLDSNSGRAVTPNPVTISGNTFTKVDVDGTTPKNKVSTRGLLQIPSKGDYINTAIILDGNTATNCGPILRQLNTSAVGMIENRLTGDLTGLGGELTFTCDSEKKEGAEKPAQPTIYTVKFSGSDVADMKVASGTEITLPTATKYGYTFKGWKLGTETKNANDKVTISSDTTFTAVWQSNSSSSGSSSAPVTPPTTTTPTTSGTTTTTTTTVKPTTSGTTASATVPEATVSSAVTTAVEAAKTSGTTPVVEVKVDAASTATEVKTTLPVKALETVAKSGAALTVSSPVANVSLPTTVVDKIAEAAGTGDVTLSVEKVAPTALTEAQQAAIGETKDAVILDLNLTAGNTKISDLGGTVEISVPYTPKANEDMAHKVVWFIADDGTITPCEGTYNAATKTFDFKTSHFSTYVLTDFPFGDVSTSYWAYSQIAWAYNNGYMNGNSATTFNPMGSVTRQQLWMVLARLSGETPADMTAAKDWAVASKISDGTNPTNTVSRQQMAAMLYRYAQLKGYDTTKTADLTKFPDSASVASYASAAMSWAVASGIISGTSAGTLNPAGTTTRAQFAVMLSRFCQNVAK